MKNRQADAIPIQYKLLQKYDSVEFTLANGISDYDLRDNQANAFKDLDVYTTINIRTDKNLTIKINSASNSAITVTSSRPFELDNLMEITNIYITNASGDTANIKIIGINRGV